MFCSRACCSACLCVFAYLAWGHYTETTQLWSRFHEWDYECEHPALPVNQSGVKVIVAGFAKTGTRTMSRTLYQLGYDHSYHSEEFGLNVWANLADKFWMRETGGKWSETPRPGNPLAMTTTDAEVLRRTSPAELAAAISRCKVDAIAFDGIEKLFWPVLDVSPDAKVIVLNWRTFKQWRKSLEVFGPLLVLEMFTMGCLYSAGTIFPWGALLHVVDPLLGRQIENLLRTGGPPICQEYGVLVGIFHHVVNLRRIAARWFSGISLFPDDEETYNEYFRQVKAAVPAENLMEWDMRTHKFEDLCKFLGIENCPRSGNLPRANNCFIFVQDFPVAFVMRLPIIFFFHWLNYRILKILFWPCCGRRAAKSKDE